MLLLANLILKPKDSALFNNLAVWPNRLQADIHLLPLNFSLGCFCQTVRLVNLKGRFRCNLRHTSADFPPAVNTSDTLSLCK